jgi:hypothetical protein
MCTLASECVLFGCVCHTYSKAQVAGGGASAFFAPLVTALKLKLSASTRQSAGQRIVRIAALLLYIE